MALNITFTGTIYNSMGVPFSGSEVRYRAFFNGVNPSSSTSKWNDLRISELGEYSCNLGDGDFLTQEGNVNVSDTVLLLFWTPNTSIQTDLDLVEWGMIEHVMTDDFLYVQDVQIRESFSPNCVFSLSGSNRVMENIYVSDVGCNDSHSWVFSGLTHRQLPMLYGQTIFIKNELPPACIDIDWKDSNIDLGEDKGGVYLHQYTTSGDYDITTSLINRSGKSCQQILPCRIYWRIPEVDFDIDDDHPLPIDDIGIGQIVNCTNTSTDPDNRAESDGWNWDWEIGDDGIYGNFNDNVNLAVMKSFSPSHQWHNPGIHNVLLRLHWYDGFSWQSIDKIKQIDQQVWTISNGLAWEEPVLISIPFIFTPNIFGDSGRPPSVDYYVDGNLDYENLERDEDFEDTYSESRTHIVKQCIEYHDGFTLKVQCEEYSVLMHPIANFIQEKYGCGFKYISYSVAGNPPIIEYQWRVKNNGEVIHTGSNSSEFYYSWPFPGTFVIEHTIIDSTPTQNTSVQTYTNVSCPIGGSGGGGIIKKVIESPVPVVRVNLRYEEDYDKWTDQMQEAVVLVELRR